MISKRRRGEHHGTVFDRGLGTSLSPNFAAAKGQANGGLTFRRNDRDRATPSSVVTARFMGDPAPGRSANDGFQDIAPDYLPEIDE